VSVSTPTALLLAIRQARTDMLSASSRAEQRDLAEDITGYVADLDDLLTHYGARLPGPWDAARRAPQDDRPGRTVPDCDITSCPVPATHLETYTLAGARTLAFVCDVHAEYRATHTAARPVFRPAVTEASVLTTVLASHVTPRMRTWDVPDDPLWPQIAWKWVVIRTETYPALATGDLRVRWVYQDLRTQDWDYHQPVRGYFQLDDIA
jgi:hypothetical protein